MEDGALKPINHAKHGLSLTPMPGSGSEVLDLRGTECPSIGRHVRDSEAWSGRRLGSPLGVDAGALHAALTGARHVAS